MRANRREPGSVVFWFQSAKGRPHGGLPQVRIRSWITTGKYYWPRSIPCSRRRKPATRRRKPLSWTRHGWAACRAWMPCRRRRCRKRRAGGGGKNCCRSKLPCGVLKKMITVIARAAVKISRRRAWRPIPQYSYASAAPRQKNCCRRPPCGRPDIVVDCHVGEFSALEPEENRSRFPSVRPHGGFMPSGAPTTCSGRPEAPSATNPDCVWVPPRDIQPGSTGHSSCFSSLSTR